jgi:hypothetical protein
MLVAYIKTQLGIGTQVSVNKAKVTVAQKEIQFSREFSLEFALIQILCGGLGLLLRYIAARAMSFAYNTIFSFYSITSVHFDLLIHVTSNLGG